MTKMNSKGQFAKATPVEPKERTIEDWLGELPEPYRAQALEARKEWPLYSATAISLTNAICIGFHWDSAPQGDLYWIAVSRWAKDPTNRALPEPWQPPVPTQKEEQDHRDALIAEYHLSVGKVTKSVIELNDKLDRIQRDIEQVRTLAHQTRTNSRGNTLVIDKILAGVDLLNSGSGFMQEIQQHKGQPWEPKVGDPSYSHSDWVTPTRDLRPLTTEEITKSIAEMSDEIDRLKREMDFLKPGSGFVQEI